MFLMLLAFLLAAGTPHLTMATSADISTARPGATVKPERTKMAVPGTIKVEQSADSIGPERPPVEQKADVPPKADPKAGAPQERQQLPDTKKPAGNAEPLPKQGPVNNSNTAPAKAEPGASEKPAPPAAKDGFRK